PKLLLIQPPVEDFYQTDIRLQPIGLAYLKAAVKKHLPEFEVIIRDYHHGWGRKTIPLPKELAYLKEYYAQVDASPFSTFHQYYHFGASFEEIAQDVNGINPDIVGISSLFSPYYREVLRTARAVKNSCPQATVIVGGSHVSCAPEMMLEDPDIDFIIRGEGERPLVEFLKAWKAGAGFESVPNLGYKKAGRLIHNPVKDNYPLAEIPAPDLSDCIPEKYLFEGRPICMILTSRGCPHQCSFCSVHRTFGKSYRRRNPEAVVAEMEQRYAAGFRVFDFEDDNLTFDRTGIQELCRLIMQTFPDRDIQLLAMNGISYKNLDEETLQLMQSAGFTHLNLALVSADQRMLNSLNRPHRVAQFSEVVRIARDLGFQITAYQILGLPGETLSGMIDTMQLLAGEPVLIGVSIFYLTPGSPIAQSFPEMTEEDIFRSRSTAMAMETEHCQRGDLFTLFIIARIINFLKGVKIEGRSAGLLELQAGGLNASDKSRWGFALLSRLLEEETLYTEKGREVTQFDVKLFQKIWFGLTQICTQEGKVIVLSRQDEYAH
ncbi:MAG: B12-binding domain-containing radical SAM protein, partial [Proteobacteria bacterium]|nr:B12-binding domain-containing radical SAM protein [Pseudomonadota bacterium]MBU1708987.1 B12-binding domain-containing radical SAM protein [Pseudomonadota bacterium]